MTPTSNKELPLAFSVALAIHLALILIFALLITTKTTQAAPIAKPEPPSDEITLVFEPAFTPPPIEEEVPTVEEEMLPDSSIPPRPLKPKFSSSEPNTDVSPENAQFIGESPSLATSDAEAISGDQKMTALSGTAEPPGDIKTTDTEFSDQDPQTELLTSPQSTPAQDQFIDPQTSTEVLQDPLPEPEPKEPEPESKPKALESEKTAVRGTLTVKGQGSTNTKESPLGRYGAQVGKIAITHWHKTNAEYKELLEPGLINYRIFINKEGRILKQGLVNKTGTSQIQMGLVVRVFRQIKIPPMPADVRKELKGEPLELTFTFNY